MAINLPPPLIHYATVQDYRNHFKGKYCTKPLATHDGIVIRFHVSRFDHLFYVSVSGVFTDKLFHPPERIDWIAAILADPSLTRYWGYDQSESNRGTAAFDPNSFMVRAFNDTYFVVVHNLRRTSNGMVEGTFHTAYVRQPWVDPANFQNPPWYPSDIGKSKIRVSRK